MKEPIRSSAASSPPDCCAATPAPANAAEVAELARRRPRSRLAEAALYVVWYLPGYLLCLLVFRLLSRTRILGRRHVPARGGALLLANHTSTLDSWFIGHALFPRPLWFPAKAELFDSPVIGAMLRGWRAFPVRRGRRDEVSRNRIAALARRYYVCLYPEGTRTRDGSLGAGRPGAARVALRAGVTTVPVFVAGIRDLLPLGRRFPRFGRRLVVAFGEPVDLSSYLAVGETDENLERLIGEVMARIAALRGECARLGLLPDGPPGEQGD